MNWQTINHVGRINEAFQELTRVCSGYVYFDDKKFTELYGESNSEVEWAYMAWAFNKDKVVAFIKELGVNQYWRPIADPSLGSDNKFPTGSAWEHTLLSKENGPIESWEVLQFNETWRDNILAL